MAAPGFAETTALVAVLERKSFAKAAKRLGLSPPRVSEMVRLLEERWGVRLVERRTRPVAATPAGEQDALESINDFRDKPASARPRRFPNRHESLNPSRGVSSSASLVAPARHPRPSRLARTASSSGVCGSGPISASSLRLSRRSGSRQR
jgi:hypothetical protein